MTTYHCLWCDNHVNQPLSICSICADWYAVAAAGMPQECHNIEVPETQAPAPTGHKLCNRCHRHKPVEEFAMRKKTGKLLAQCATCYRAYMITYQRARRARLAKREEPLHVE